jgi:hypothetical protein
VLPRFLAHLGQLHVHASAVATEWGALLFLGASGAGKSTLGAMLQGAGHELLTDDCMVLERTQLGVFTVPSYPSLRLNEDSRRHSIHFSSPFRAVAQYSAKGRLALAHHGDPRRVAAIYLLGLPAGQERPSISELRSAELCLGLVRHSFQLDMSDASRYTAHFENCSDVARDTPGFRLHYPRDFAIAPAVVEMVSHHADQMRAQGA